MQTVLCAFRRNDTISFQGNLRSIQLEIQYKGFNAKVIFSPETDTFNGEVLNTNDLLAFQVSSPEDALSAMQDTVDCYLKTLVVQEPA
jgi:predicted HicB family RNase H-like nuclease